MSAERPKPPYPTVRAIEVKNKTLNRQYLALVQKTKFSSDNVLITEVAGEEHRCGPEEIVEWRYVE